MPPTSQRKSESCNSLDKDPGFPLRTGRSFFERLGVLYEEQIRLTIVTELYMREMSQMQFFEQIGGTSYDSVRRHFKKLVEYGWLRKVRTVSSGRGRPEVFYRATELAVIDDETWGEIPRTIRDAFTIQLNEEMGDRLGDALGAAVFDRRDDRVFRFGRLALDDAGWRQAIEILNGTFHALAQEQTDAKVRLEASGQAPMLLVVQLGGFQLPTEPRDGEDRDLPLAGPVSGAPPWWGLRVAKVFSDWRNLAIVNALCEKAMTPGQLYSQIGGVSLEGFDARCKALAKLGWVARVPAEDDARSGNYYRATAPEVEEDLFCRGIPNSARRGDVWAIFRRFCEASVAALRGGTFNASPDRHLSLSTLLVDEVGWKQVMASLCACSRQLQRVEQEAAARLATTKRTAQEVGVLLAGFESPISRKALKQVN